MAYDLTAIIADVRLHALDAGTVTGLTDAQLVQILNGHYMDWWAKYETRPQPHGVTLNYGVGVYAADFTFTATNVKEVHAIRNGVVVLPQQDFFAVLARAGERGATAATLPEAVGFVWQARSDTQSTLTVAVSPNLNAALTLTFWITSYPAALSASTMTGVPAVSHDAQRILMRLTAADAAMLLGHPPAFVEGIMAPVASSIVAAMGLDKRLEGYRSVWGAK